MVERKLLFVTAGINEAYLSRMVDIYNAYFRNVHRFVTLSIVQIESVTKRGLEL